VSKKLIYVMVCLFVATVFGLTGCGGGGGAGTTGPTVSGVAATGSPISGTVYLKDSSSPAKEISTTIKSDGSYSLDVTGLTAPFLLKAVGTANGQSYTLYSLAGVPGVANINPLSHLAVVQANHGADPAVLYANLTPAQVQAIRTTLATVIPQIQALLQQILSQYGVATTDFISDAYAANHTGLDLLFDMIAITANNGNLVVTNKVSGAGIITTTLNGNTLSGQVAAANIPTMPISTMGAVYVFPANADIATGSATVFTAIVIGTMHQNVTWSIVEAGGGTISSAGAYVAPATAGTYHVKATSVADPSKSATVAIKVEAFNDTSTFTTALVSGKAFPYSSTYAGDTGPPTLGTLTMDPNGTFTIQHSGLTFSGTWSVNANGQLVALVISGTVQSANFPETDVFTITSSTATTIVATDSWTSANGEHGTNFVTFTLVN
jgi:hypothetical protein